MKKIYVCSFCGTVICVFSLILFIDESKELFVKVTEVHPCIAGFVQFAFLATVGELIAYRISTSEWDVPSHIVVRFVLWGIIGVINTIAFKLFAGGTEYLFDTGLIPGAHISIWKAFVTNIACQLLLSPFVMAFQNVANICIILKEKKVKRIRIDDVLYNFDLDNYVKFLMLKTIPFFWLPVQTIVFLMPSAFQITLAAYLSIVLGFILGLKNKKYTAEKEGNR